MDCSKCAWKNPETCKACRKETERRESTQSSYDALFKMNRDFVRMRRLADSARFKFDTMGLDKLRVDGSEFGVQ